MRLANLIVVTLLFIAACDRGDSINQESTNQIATAQAEEPDSLTLEEKMTQFLQHKLEQRQTTPEWVVETQGVPDACVLKEELRILRDYAGVSTPEDIGSDLSAYYDHTVKGLVVARARTIFDSNFRGCRNTDGFMELAFIERDQMIREMLETGVAPEDLELTPQVIRERLLESAREVFEGNVHLLEEPSDSNGGAGACRTESMEWYAVGRMTETYHFTAQDLGVDATAFEKCVYGN